MKLGIDIGSTTIKLVLLSDKNEVIYKVYERHYSKIQEALLNCLVELHQKIPQVEEFVIAITGSAGMGIAEKLQIDFIQEVFATKIATNILQPKTDVVIELGGEDAKILFLSNGIEVRMNGTCAGGTGAFIDQIASLLSVTTEEMNNLAKKATKTYSIASRCGVFAKSDIQPLLNQGAKKEDLASSIFYAVVNQTISGLAQGREIKGNVLYLGGPLTFLPTLRDSFNKVLQLSGISPKNSLHFVAIGCALCADKSYTITNLINKIKEYKVPLNFEKTQALFKNQEEYKAFTERHNKNVVTECTISNYEGKVFLGIDAGSTTIKVVVITEEEDILFSEYMTNGGNPIPPIKTILERFYHKHPRAKICASAVTGYGEDMIKAAFNLDYGLVETIAHSTAAKKYNKDVDFIIDIGGQDMKCFKIVNGVIDDIFLNEACSSGCGSFLQSFASVLNYNTKDFAKLGLFAESPVDLGSRCTVFMNSSVKQAQKDGASIENISAGLSISVVKNAIYKVIRASKASDLGKNIVVQGGTFLSDAVLRAFEKEINGEVIRPNIAGLMGAYGAALYCKSKKTEVSNTITLEGLKNFTHSVFHSHCRGCQNQCLLTINSFDGKRKYIAGNRCDTPTRINSVGKEHQNLFDYKRQLLKEYMDIRLEKPKAKIGIPMVLNNFELLPFWSKFFTSLGFEVISSGFSTNETFSKGLQTIPSDTVCFPAKLVHGHIEELLTKNIDAIFYPCLSYNINEHRSDNHFNCPIVAYYPETVINNIKAIKKIKYIYDYIGIHRIKDFIPKIQKILSSHFGEIKIKDVKKATKLAFLEYDAYLSKIRQKGTEIINFARKHNKQIIVLAGRPYHLDSKINHDIDKLIVSYDAAVLTEDAICHLSTRDYKLAVLNQWTYHARLYDAADYIRSQKDMNLVQLVSFGCGIDAITTDEVRAILRKDNKIYTQIKIDEITNLGATKIRIRSLLATI